MPRQPSPEVRNIYAYAEDCKRKAKVAPSEKSRQDLLTLQQSWANLAHSYEVAESVLGLHETDKT